MKTLLLLSILGLALVSAKLQSEDHYTKEADVVAVDDSVDDSAEARRGCFADLFTGPNQRSWGDQTKVRC